MKTKHFLPPREVFERYEPHVRFNLISGYHVRGKDGWHTNNNGIYTRYSEKTGEITVGTFGHEIAVKKAFDEEVLPVLRGMKAVKWRGFYDEDIEYVLSTTNLDRRLL